MDIWTAKQHKPRPLTKKTVAPDYARSSDLSVSIVTPSFNQAQYLGATISSVLAQSTPNLHYRVQDGGSSDGSLDLLRTFEGRINFDSIQDEGQSHALNLGFQETNGDVMAYLNSDDILLPDSIAIVLDFFRKNPEIDIVYSHRIFIDEKGLETGRAILPSHDGEALKWMDFVPQETMFWRRRVWDQIGPFDESLQFAMDWEFLLRASEANFRLARISTFLGAFRVHDQQKTSSWTEIGESEMMLVRERYLGFRPSRRQINNAVRPYLNRQAIYSSLARANLLRYQRASI